MSLPLFSVQVDSGAIARVGRVSGAARFGPHQTPILHRSLTAMGSGRSPQMLNRITFGKGKVSDRANGKGRGGCLYFVGAPTARLVRYLDSIGTAFMKQGHGPQDCSFAVRT